MIRSILTLSFLALGITVIGCDPDTGTSTTGSGPAVTAAEACDALASALCSKIQSCSPFLVEAQYVDIAQCEERAAINCPATFDAEGSKSLPADTKSCANAIGGASCDDLFAGRLPAACEPTPGTLANGSPCGREVQCASTQCNKDGDLCGVCADPVAEGGACPNGNECARGLTCAADKCVAQGVENDSCSDAAPCGFSLVCSAGKCVKGVAAGQPCVKDMFGDNCDRLAGLTCNMMNVCQPIKTAGPGEPCGLQGMEFVVCKASGTCRFAPMSAQGTCVAPAADGAACDDIQGPGCMQNAECINDVCTLDDTSTCN